MRWDSVKKLKRAARGSKTTAKAGFALSESWRPCRRVNRLSGAILGSLRLWGRAAGIGFLREQVPDIALEAPA